MEINLEAQRGPTRDWISQDTIKRAIARDFRNFLLSFEDDKGDQVYQGRLAEMCSCTTLSVVLLA